MKNFILEIKDNKLGFVLNLLIRLSIFYFLAEVMLFQDDPRFAGKAIPIRNLVIVGTLSFLFPFLYFIKKKWKKYPYWFDNIYLSIFWLDMAGNSFDLYDSYFYFDLFPHFLSTGALAAVFYGIFKFRALKAVVIANVIHGLLEGQEIFTDVFLGTHNVRGAFDSTNDLIAGVLGAIIYVWLTSHFLKRKALKLKVFVSVLVVFSVLAMVFHKNIAANFKSIFLISESFSQITIKPLSAFTQAPIHSKIEINEEITADLFVPKEKYTPKSKNKRPAIIVAMGVKTKDADKPVILDFSETLSRLGYVVLWPRLKVLDQGVSLIEDPQTFVTAFNYLEKQDFVDGKRISYIGFSVGSSVAFAAASDPSISDKTNSLIFFGGYYDIFDYLESIHSQSMMISNKRIDWKPNEGATNHINEILENMNLGDLEKVIAAKPPEFKNISPSNFTSEFKSRILILHEKSDGYVPYVESIKLSDNLSKDIDKKFVLINLFEHVQPRGGFSKEILGEIFKLYGFTTEVFLRL